jgi:cytidyltransferase-like protein
MQTRVLTTGVFDLFHLGHLYALQKARAFGNILVVGIHDDDAVECYKRRPIISFQDRLEIIAALSCVDEVVEAPVKITKEFYKHHRIDIHIQGNDMLDLYEAGKQLGIFHIVDRYMEIDTTSIIEKIAQRVVEESENAGQLKIIKTDRD